MLPTDMRGDVRWLSGGFLLTFCSGLGQTYFIAIFAGHLKEDLALSDGRFGLIYAAGTLLSAFVLIWAGKVADVAPVRWLGAGVMAGLAATALGMAAVPSAAVLVVLMFGLRFFGQGMLTHTAMTAMGRWFSRKRGRAVSIAALGLSVAEAAMPLVAVFLIAHLGWRLTWVAFAALLVCVMMPVLIVLLARERVPESRPAAVPADGHVADGPSPRRDWTRAQVLRTPLFYVLMPGVLAQPFIQTGIFFNQVALVEAKGWSLSWFAAGFPVLAGVNIVSALATGWLVDRFGAVRILPFYLLPLALAAALAAWAVDPYVVPVFMALIGLTAGAAVTILGALWPELFGTAHLGAIRSLVVSGVVFASALAPGLMGVLLDAGLALEIQLAAMAVYCVLAALLMGLLMPRLRRMTAAA